MFLRKHALRERYLAMPMSEFVAHVSYLLCVDHGPLRHRGHSTHKPHRPIDELIARMNAGSNADICELAREFDAPDLVALIIERLALSIDEGNDPSPELIALLRDAFEKARPHLTPETREMTGTFIEEL